MRKETLDRILLNGETIYLERYETLLDVSRDLYYRGVDLYEEVPWGDIWVIDYVERYWETVELLQILKIKYLFTFFNLNKGN